MSTVLTSASSLAFIDSITFDPFLRGFLSVMVGVVVLFGSVYLLLATNSGPRLGMLLAMTGLFGWFVTMGVIWWIYGIGWIGNDAVWEFDEVVIGDLEAAATEDLRELPSLGDNPELEDLAEAAVSVPGYDGPQPETVADTLNLNGWSYLPTSNRARGDAEAQANAFLTSGENDLLTTAEFGDAFSSTAGYKVVAAFRKGGKPVRANDSVVERVTNRITNTLRVVHPIHYAAVMVQPVEESVTLTGEAPAFPVPDADEPVVTVLLTRNLGFKRLRPAIFTIFSAIIFGILANMLHRRDKFEMEQRARAEEEAKEEIAAAKKAAKDPGSAEADQKELTGAST